VLKWIKEEIPNSKEEHFSSKVGDFILWCETDYEWRIANWGIRIDGSYDIIEETSNTIEEAKREAEKWLGTLFMPIVKHTIAEVAGTEIFNGNKLEEKASDVLDAVLETISENNYIENGEQGADTPKSIGGGNL